MATVKVRYLERRKLVDGTIGYVWNNRHAAKAGMEREWLGTDEVEAIKRAGVLNQTWDEIRTAEKTAGPVFGTVAWLAAKVEGSEEHKRKKAKLKKEAEFHFGYISDSPVGKKMVADVDDDYILAYLDRIREARGVSKAHKTATWLRFLLIRSVRAKELPDVTSSPMEGMRIERPAPREVFGEEDEVEAVIAKAIEMGRHSIAVAIRIGFDTGQREGDILKMKWNDIVDGEVLVKQGKGGARVRIPCTPDLAAILAEVDKTSTHIIVSEVTKHPYKQDNFMHRAADVIKAVRIDDKPIEGKRFGDLRRSAAVQLAKAEVPMADIAAVTGHTYEQCQRILEHYLPRTTAAARRAIEKLVAMREAR